MKYKQGKISVPNDTFPSARYEREVHQCLKKCKPQAITDVSH